LKSGQECATISVEKLKGIGVSRYFLLRKCLCPGPASVRPWGVAPAEASARDFGAYHLGGSEQRGR